MPAIGFVTKTDKGFEGSLKTLSINTPIRFVANSSKTNDRAPDYTVYGGDRVEIGAAWNNTNKEGNEYVSLTLAAPEFGRIYANLGRAAGQDDDDTFAIIWNSDR